MRSRSLVFALTGVCVCGVVLWLTVGRSAQRPRSASIAARRLEEARRVAATPAPELRIFVERNRKAKSPEVQDLVGVARVRLAYDHARRKDFKAARMELKIAEREYRGTGAMSADWGGVPDQAAYQAAACLMAEGRDGEARTELLDFLRNRPLSPLVHAVHKRLARLGGGTAGAEADALLQAAVSKQEARIRFETSVCGPRVIEYLLERGFIKGPRRDYRELARLCGTNDDGTTLEGLRKGLAAVGAVSHAYRLNREDLGRAALPAILLEGDHYVALTGISPSGARVYDPRFKAEREIPLPSADDPDFFVNAVLLRPLEVKP